MKNNRNYTISEEVFEIKSHSNTKYCPLIYELIPAHGCSFECAYCNVYSMYDEKEFYPITVFRNYPNYIAKTIDEHRAQGMEPVYYFSPKTDVFQEALVETKIVHQTLEVLKKKKAQYILVTKGRLPDNEILDLLIATKDKGRVLVSYGMQNEEHARVLEPNAATLQQRYELAKACYDNDIPAMGIIEPILPLSDLSFVKDIIKMFVSLKIDHFAIDFARISKDCLEGLIQRLPELAELRDVYYSKDAIPQTFGTGAYVRKPVERFAPSAEFHDTYFNLIKNYAKEFNATVSICNYFPVKGINTDAYKRGFLCFGIYDPVRADEFLKTTTCSSM